MRCQILGTSQCLKKFRRGSCGMPDHRADRLLLPRLCLQPRRRKTQRRSSPPPRRRHAAQRTQGRSYPFASLKIGSRPNGMLNFFLEWVAAHREFVLFRLKRIEERTEQHRMLESLLYCSPAILRALDVCRIAKAIICPRLQRGSNQQRRLKRSLKQQGDCLACR